jgi:hypothetical protein
MTAWFILAAGVVAVMSAVRSTWSPCGLSMLASITPLSEVGRGHRYRTTPCWSWRPVPCRSHLAN